MTKAQRVWSYRPARPEAPKVAASVKDDVQRQATHLIETVLEPRHIKPPPEDNQFNFLTAISTKWWRHYFYFCATYCSPGPNAISPSFELKFARMEYMGMGRFNLAFVRHTGEWIELHQDVSLAECFSAITEDPFFDP